MLVQESVPPSAEEVAQRLLILLALKIRAQRLMMLWDFVFHLRASLKNHFNLTTTWTSLGWRGQWAKLRARWKFRQESRGFSRALHSRGMGHALSESEQAFLRTGLSQQSRDTANEIFWGIESIACLAWAIGEVPDLPPGDEQVVLSLDETETWQAAEALIRRATLRPQSEIEAAHRLAFAWHWRARQHLLELRGAVGWPPPNTSPEGLEDLSQLGITSLETLLRANVRALVEEGVLSESETLEGDFVVGGQAYRTLDESKTSELEQIARHRHKAFNWLLGLAPGNDWDRVPLET